MDVRRFRRLAATPFVLSIVFVASCKPASRPAVVGPPSVAIYEARGVLQEMREEGRRALIAHEAIEGYMDAMTMEFDTADAAEFRDLLPGDVITFRLSVTDDRGWIEHARKVGHTAPLPPPETLESLPPGSPLPDCAFTNSRGETQRLSDFKGRALAFTFIFTRCPFPDFCPLMNRNFMAAREALAAGTRTEWHLLSLSFDPDYDTPERLATYAAPYRPDPAHWTFATGRAEEIRGLGKAFGLAISSTGVSTDHNLRTVVVDAAGRVQKVFVGNAWKADELVSELRRAMDAGR